MNKKIFFLAAAGVAVVGLAVVGYVKRAVLREYAQSLTQRLKDSDDGDGDYDED